MVFTSQYSVLNLQERTVKNQTKLLQMETALIKLTSSGTMKLLKELEALKLLRILKTEHAEELPLSEKYAGKLFTK